MNPTSTNRFAWLIAGVLFGLALSYYWPHEPARAMSASENDKFAMCTVESTPGNSEGIFVLDAVTGRLIGGVYAGQVGAFTQTYARNLAADFKITEEGQYVMVPGGVLLRAAGGAGGSPANGAIYVGELTSGLVNMYGFMHAQNNRAMPLQELQLIASFPFRQASR